MELVSHQVIVQLIAATTSTAGLRVRCDLDTHSYAAGIKVSDDALASVHITGHAFHGEWNSTIHPNQPAPTQ